MLFGSVARADNEPVPMATPFDALLVGAKLMVHQHVNGFEFRANGDYTKSIGNGFSIWTRELSQTNLKPGQTSAITKIEMIDSYGLVNVQGWALRIHPEDYPKIKTVEDFNRRLSGVLSLVWNESEVDPFPGVSKEVKHDLLMTRILAAIKSDKHADALPDFARLEKLGEKQPESFYYYYVLALDKAGRRVPAKERATAFLNTYGKTSKYYNDVLAIMVK